MTTAPVNRLLLFLALSALVLKSEAKGLLKLSRSGDVLESLAFRTRSCDECGMTLFGTISVKVCGSVGCCYTPWMQGRFDEGGMDYMSGATIGECYQFLFREAGEAPLEVGDAVTDIQVTVFHQGTDMVSLDIMEIQTANGSMFRCYLPSIGLDDSDFTSTTNCLLLTSS